MRAYKGETVSTVNAMLGSRSPSEVVSQLEMLDRFAHNQQQDVREVADLRDELAAQKAPLDEMVAQLARTEAQLAAKKKQIDAEIDRLQELRLEVYGSGGGGPLRRQPVPAAIPAARRARRSGSPARRSASPTSGGRRPELVRLLRADHGRMGAGRRVSLPHNAARAEPRSPAVRQADLRPGDLVFYYSAISHVGMYVGNGWIVHASQAGQPVKMKKVDDGPIHSYGRPG